MKVKLEELKAALAELEARGKGDFVILEISDNRLNISCQDRYENLLEAIVYNDRALGAQFRMTHRLMYMEDKKRT